jgi:hypothetical protein
MEKRRILRIVLWLSFTPYIFLIIYSLYHAIFGYDVYTWILPQYLRTIYGWDAFLEVFLLMGLSLFVIPIIPICFLYQIMYFIGYLIKIIRFKRIK